jgi:hypothetical protein
MSQEKPDDDPRQRSDSKQTDEPWKGKSRSRQARLGKVARYQHALTDVRRNSNSAVIKSHPYGGSINGHLSDTTYRLSGLCNRED